MKDQPRVGSPENHFQIDKTYRLEDIEEMKSEKEGPSVIPSLALHRTLKLYSSVMEFLLMGLLKVMVPSKLMVGASVKFEGFVCPERMTVWTRRAIIATALNH